MNRLKKTKRQSNGNSGVYSPGADGNKDGCIDVLICSL